MSFGVRRSHGVPDSLPCSWLDSSPLLSIALACARAIDSRDPAPCCAWPPPIFGLWFRAPGCPPFQPAPAPLLFAVCEHASVTFPVILLSEHVKKKDAVLRFRKSSPQPNPKPVANSVGSKTPKGKGTSERVLLVVRTSPVQQQNTAHSAGFRVLGFWGLGFKRARHCTASTTSLASSLVKEPSLS